MGEKGDKKVNQTVWLSRRQSVPNQVERTSEWLHLGHILNSQNDLSNIFSSKKSFLAIASLNNNSIFYEKNYIVVVFFI